MLSRIMNYSEAAFAADTPREASIAFFNAMERFSPTYLQTRLYRRPSAPLTSVNHWAAGGFIIRIAPDGWAGSLGFNYVCFECNPMLTPVRESRTRHRFSDFAPHQDRRFGAYWDALSQAKIKDTLCATSYGPGGQIAGLTLGFNECEFDDEEAFAIQMAGLVVTERIMSLGEAPPAEAVALTRRERDSLAFVAEGKTDWEISVILGVAEATARFHVDNARRKLGAVNRAQAVARLVTQRFI